MTYQHAHAKLKHGRFSVVAKEENVESVLLLIVFIALFISLIAYIAYRAYNIGVEAGVKIGYGGAVQDFLHQQAQAAEQQMYAQQQLEAAQQQADMEARSIGFSTSEDKKEEPGCKE